MGPSGDTPSGHRAQPQHCRTRLPAKPTVLGSLKYRNFDPVWNFVSFSKRESASNHTSSAPSTVTCHGAEGCSGQGAGTWRLLSARPRRTRGRPTPPCYQLCPGHRATLPTRHSIFPALEALSYGLLGRGGDGRPLPRGKSPHQGRMIAGGPPPTALQPREEGKRSVCFLFDQTKCCLFYIC